MKYFIDCGAHHGEGLKHFIDMYNVDDTWSVYSFEPNLESFAVLKDVKYKNCNINFVNKGVWTEDTVLEFHPETTSESYGSRPDGAGSTFVSLNDWNIKNNGNWGAGDFLNSYKIEVIDLCNFLNSLKDVEFLLIKMDIEGSEYPLLRKMLNDPSINLVNDMYVEFHDWAMSSESVDSTNQIMSEVASKGINIKKWV
jgi:FkbM family methyltransferase